MKYSIKFPGLRKRLRGILENSSLMLPGFYGSASGSILGI